jgi:hypothetical protein
MNDPLNAVYQYISVTNRFPVNSRYYGIKSATLKAADGSEIPYLCRRFVPPAERLALLQVYRVSQNQRLDTIAAKYLGDPEQFWRVCDANKAMQPDELTKTVGRSIRITWPEGLPGRNGA